MYFGAAETIIGSLITVLISVSWFPSIQILNSGFISVSFTAAFTFIPVDKVPVPGIVFPESEFARYLSPVKTCFTIVLLSSMASLDVPSE